jgi:hypothetical protein
MCLDTSILLNKCTCKGVSGRNTFVDFVSVKKSILDELTKVLPFIKSESLSAQIKKSQNIILSYNDLSAVISDDELGESVSNSDQNVEELKKIITLYKEQGLLGQGISSI